jgi:hypothetical protein
MIKNNVFEANFTKKYAYAPDFLLLETLDSIWINEVYLPHSSNLIELT